MHPPHSLFGARVARAGALAALGCSAVLVLVAVGPAAARPDASPSAATPGACTRYAAPNGRDAGPGTRQAPFATPQRLFDSLRPGQVGCLRGGVYTEGEAGYILRAGRGGRSGAPIRLRSYPGERARLVGTVYVPHRSDNIVFSRLVLEGAGGGEHTIKIYAADTVVEDSELTNQGRGESCMMLGSVKYGIAVRTIVRRNRLHDCGSSANGNKDHAIYVSGTLGARILGNVFWNTAGYTVHLYPYARRTLVAHNVIDGGPPSARGGVIFAGNDEYASSENVVEHNVIAYARDNVASGWGGDVGRGNVFRKNCVWAGRDDNVDTGDGGFAVSGNLVASPAFVARARHDYRLRVGSRCLQIVGYDAAARLPLRRQ